MNRGRVLSQAVVPGMLAGLAGGLVLGLAMAALGLLPLAASPVPGVALHGLIGALLGAGFGLLIWHQGSRAGETLFWGMTYGVLWWFLGPLTLQPLIMGGALAWDVHAAQAAFPSLLGYIWYGAMTGLVFVFLAPGRTEASDTPGRGSFLRGAVAGLLAAGLLGAMLEAQDQLLAFASMMSGSSRGLAWLVTLLIGLLAGLGWVLLYGGTRSRAGALLIRGMVYGFLWWVAGALTLMPLVGGEGLTWSLAAARSGFATLPGYLLFGAALALFFNWLEGLVQLLFGDATPDPDQEGAGAEGLRAIGRGGLAGLVGGLVFTLVMVQIGFLPVVASLVGSASVLTGFIVHLVISDLIGASYGLLFRRQAYDLGSALGWGVVYGFLWWILGPLTLMPILLGGTPQWTVEVAASLMPSLIGHLAYGAGLGVTFFLLEARYNPWWISRSQAEDERVARQKEALLSSAPALWVLVVAISLTLPVLLGMP